MVIISNAVPYNQDSYLSIFVQSHPIISQTPLYIIHLGILDYKYIHTLYYDCLQDINKSLFLLQLILYLYQLSEFLFNLIVTVFILLVQHIQFLGFLFNFFFMLRTYFILFNIHLECNAVNLLTCVF